MIFREVLLPQKLDLDSMMTAFLAGVSLPEDNIVFVNGSAPSEKLKDPRVLCIEVGCGLPRNNTFDHHKGSATASDSSAKVSSLSATAQYFERLANLVRYIDEVDQGEYTRTNRIGFPSLVQLVSGMNLVEREPIEKLKYGQQIFRAIIQLGLDPYQDSMTPVLEIIPQAKSWAKAKKIHEEGFAKVLADASFFTTKQGRKLGVVETSWVGAPGTLYGVGCDLAVALNPAHQNGNLLIKKFTVATQRGKGVSLVPKLLEALEELEIACGGSSGWGGPNHGTIIGSPQEFSSVLSVQQVIELVIELL